jgi:hypothetical protein
VPADDKTELEAALAEKWDRETLAVYADHLQATGDPRGELIALDLELATRSTPDMVVRRASLLSSWLGRLVPSDPHTPWIGDSFRYGFVEDLVLDDRDPNAAENLAAMLASPLAPYLKRVTIRGSGEHVAQGMRQLAGMPHRWLSHVVLRSFETIDDAAVDAFIAAAPHVDTLEVGGEHVLEAFPHPALRVLRVTGGNALPALFSKEAPLATVRELDLALQPLPDPEQWRQPFTGPLRPIVLPALRVLDLSRCSDTAVRFGGGYDDEDYDPDTDGAESPSALAVLGSQAVRSQLVRLRLPALRSSADFDALEALIADMPVLEQVELARSSYYHAPDLTNPRVALIRPAPWPWPTPDTIVEGDAIHVLCPGSRSGDTVPIADAAAVMERRFEDLDADARYAWTRFWVFVAELGQLPWKRDPHRSWTDERTLPAHLLVTALEACDIGGSGGWRELRDELRFRRPLPPDAVITVHRVRSVVP